MRKSEIKLIENTILSFRETLEEVTTSEERNDIESRIDCLEWVLSIGGAEK